MSAGRNRIGGTDKDVFHARLVFLLAEGVELLAYPVGDVFGQVVDEAEKFVGRHDGVERIEQAELGSHERIGFHTLV